MLWSQVGDGGATLTFEGSSGDSTSEGSSGEEEWQDKDMEFTPKRGINEKVKTNLQDVSRSDAEGDKCQLVTGRVGNALALGVRAVASIGDKMRETAAHEARRLSSDSNSEPEWTKGKKNDEDGLNQDRGEQESERVPLPEPLPPPSSPGGESFCRSHTLSVCSSGV